MTLIQPQKVPTTISAVIPMPDNEADILVQFDEVLKKMDLPPDKVRLLRDYDLKKKWELVCDQKKMYEVTQPSVYIEKLLAFSDRKASRKKKKLLGDESSTEVLKHIEISLRTNSIDWVRSFLDESNNGLNILIDYLNQLQDSGVFSNSLVFTDLPSSRTSTLSSVHAKNGFTNGVESNSSDDTKVLKKSPSINNKNRRASIKNNNIGETQEDIHVCISCLRAIMNNKYGFNMVFSDSRAIYCIARTILHRSLRTKSLVLELLAAICLVKGGHELIIDAFDRFKLEYKERHRFEALLSIFRNPGEFHVDFMVACMQFINIVVHSVDDMNYRIFLQYEFSQLGLDDYLETLKSNESDLLHIQVSAYLDNMFDVGVLVNDSDQKNQLAQSNERLTMQLSAANEKLQEVEADYISRLASLDHRLRDLTLERAKLLDLYQKTDSEVNTLHKVLSQKDQQSRQEQSRLESRISELETIHQSMTAGLQVTQSPATSTKSDSIQRSAPTPPPPPSGPQKSTTAPPPPPPPPPPPAPPLPPINGNAPFPPPPLHNMLNPPANDVMTIKRVVQTRNKLPQLNWSALKPNQVKETVFNELDDEKIIDKIDFAPLEDHFKIGQSQFGTTSTPRQLSPGHNPVNGTTNTASMKKDTLLDNKRLQNIAITRRKLAMPPNEIMYAVHKFDLNALPPDSVDVLLRIAPSADDVQNFKNYEAAQKPLTALSEEDQFLAQLAKIERLEHKLRIMSFMGTFSESADLIDPQFTNLTAASRCAKNATDFHRVLEIILAYGNYMNSGRRGGVYGFKLSSLDSLVVMKSSADRSLTLMHLIADTIQKKFPHLLKFGDAFKFAEKASGIMWDSVLIDMKELEFGYELAKKERELKGVDCPQTLVDFLNACDSRMTQLQNNCKLATKAFETCVEFYGDSARSQQPNVFFSRLTTFAKQFQIAVNDNAERAKAELRQREDAEKKAEISKNRAVNKVEIQGAMLDELSARINDAAGGSGRKATKQSKLDKSQIADGDFEKIVNAMKEGEYDTFQGPKRAGNKRPTNPPPTAPKKVRPILT